MIVWYNSQLHTARVPNKHTPHLYTHVQHAHHAHVKFQLRLLSKKSNAAETQLNNGFQYIRARIAIVVRSDKKTMINIAS